MRYTVPKPQQYHHNFFIQKQIRFFLQKSSKLYPLQAGQRENNHSISNESQSNLKFGEIISFDEVVKLADKKDLEIYVRRLGPFYRVICRDKVGDQQILALSTGFIIPFVNILHGERLEVLVRQEKGTSSAKGGIFGLGFWLGMALFSYAYQLGCRKLEILSINDYDYQAEKLLKYYQFFDFKVVKQVEGGSLGDLVDMVVWGGVGTRMDAEIEPALRKWGPILRRQFNKQNVAQIRP
eukprot:TRINITY_DN10939_c1_g1_i8.p3 TRINITY_DN10939_c1_g1~~TRINITY_DN10939_c1_g1_i8.p3  ORF type:complete len:238 (-),score=22.34 TRINITY_DN10939_c1_g1_i8:1414-2127(-)